MIDGQARESGIGAEPVAQLGTTLAPTSRLTRIVPGVIVAVLIAVASFIVAEGETRLLGHPVIEALVVALVLGMLVRFVWRPSATYEPGIRFAGKEVLEVSVVLLGIRLDRFTPPESRPEARARLMQRFAIQVANDDRGLILCSVGRLVPRKGVAWFVDNVMPSLPDDVRFLVAGEGPERARIEAAIDRHRLSDRVGLLGAVSDEDLQALYQGADLFMMPNVPVPGDMEGFGLVMVEAGLCGLPVVASGIEGIADVVTDGLNGHLVGTGDAAGFADAIMRYHHKPSELSAASHRARAHTVEKFGWEAVTDRYIETIGRRLKSQG